MKALFRCLLFLIGSSFTASAAVDLGRPAAATPYDRYLSPVRTVLGSLERNKPDLKQVASLMKQGRSFRYHLDDPYVPAMPSVTEKTRVGDCKDKALWLCDQLNDSSVRFVIGKTHRKAKISHAWVMWQHEGRWWILDCTLKTAPIAADTLPVDRYVPLYSYSKNSRYLHTGTPIRVAASVSGRGAKVAARLRK